MNVKVNGLIGLLDYEMKRDELRKSHVGQQIVALQDEKQNALNDVPAVVTFLLTVVVAIVVYNIAAVFPTQTQGGITLACAALTLFFGGNLVYEKFRVSPGMLAIDEQIKALAATNPQEAEILAKL